MIVNGHAWVRLGWHITWKAMTFTWSEIKMINIMWDTMKGNDNAWSIIILLGWHYITKNEVILGACITWDKMKGNEHAWSELNIALWKVMTAHVVKLRFHYMRWSGIEMRYSNTKINSIYMKWNNKMASHERQWQIARDGIKEIKWQGWLSGHREHLPSTNVTRVQFPYSASNVDWVCWFSAMRGFSPGTPVFPLTKIWFDL